jgi:integrase
MRIRLRGINRITKKLADGSRDKPWTEGGFRASWRKAQSSVGITGVTFNDLRGTAVTRLALVGCTEAEIAAITGHSLRDVRSILDANYLHRDPALADNAITKLETGTKTSQLSAQPIHDGPMQKGEKRNKIKWLGN